MLFKVISRHGLAQVLRSPIRRVWSCQSFRHPALSSAGLSVHIWATAAGAGATCAVLSQSFAAPAQCAGFDDAASGMVPCLGVGALVAAAAYWFSRQPSSAAQDGPVRSSDGDDALDGVLDQMRTYFVAGSDAAQQFQDLVVASASTPRKGVVIENLPSSHDRARRCLEAIDTDGVGVVSLPEFMALAAMSSLMNPRRSGASPPSLNDIAFEFFAAVDANTDGQITEHEWRSLHRIMNIFGMLPSLEKTGLAEGNVDVMSFVSCCRKSLDKRRLFHRYGKNGSLTS
eukprot:TRINITY_DN43219_c0_g1_i1.p1 TRINITY_DN43219_c0_g1~~TRINITY_DN43219_c0_g1_i1.p1  ORF type:complete len:297 (+),score=39.05 TRINITY_DN43219_c0_g1_i1:36-893(+)